MSPISRLTGGALALTGAVLAVAAVSVVLLLSPMMVAPPGASSAHPHRVVARSTAGVRRAVAQVAPRRLSR